MATETTGYAHLSDERCADHVLGLLGPGDAGRDLEHAAACPACEARLRAHAAAHDRARARVREGLAPPVLRPAVPLWRSPGPLKWGAAAAFVMIVFAPWLVRRASRDEQPFAWLPSGSGTVRRAEGTDPHLAAGLEAYARRDVAAAERELSVARAAGSAESARRVFLASAVLARGDAGRAIELLESVNFDQDVPEPWRGDGLRTLELAWRRAGRVAQADSLARELAARESGERP
jgi:hypothetical protein